LEKVCTLHPNDGANIAGLSKAEVRYTRAVGIPRGIWDFRHKNRECRISAVIAPTVRSTRVALAGDGTNARACRILR
jgi:hypothetical protein